MQRKCSFLPTALFNLCGRSVHFGATYSENADFNEKYAFRCFLLRIGMIGAEYKAARKVLLRNLTGSSAFKNGTASSDTAAENGGKYVETYLIISTKPR